MDVRITPVKRDPSDLAKATQFIVGRNLKLFHRSVSGPVSLDLRDVERGFEGLHVGRGEKLLTEHTKHDFKRLAQLLSLLSRGLISASPAVRSRIEN